MSYFFHLPLLQYFLFISHLIPLKRMKLDRRQTLPMLVGVNARQREDLQFFFHLLYLFLTPSPLAPSSLFPKRNMLLGLPDYVFSDRTKSEADRPRGGSEERGYTHTRVNLARANLTSRFLHVVESLFHPPPLNITAVLFANLHICLS